MDVPTGRPFSLQTEEKDGSTVVHLEGELDLAGVRKLREALHSAQHADVSQIIVDLRGLTFLDSTGLGVLIAADLAGATGMSGPCSCGATQRCIACSSSRRWKGG